MDENHTLEYDIVASSGEAVTAIQQINQALITLRGTVQSVTGMFKKGLTIQVHGLENLDKMISGLRAVTPPTVNVDVDTTDATHTLDELQQRIKDINRDVLNNPTNGPPDTRGMRAAEAIKQLQEYEKQQKKVKEAAAQIDNPTNGKPDTRGMKAADAIKLLQAYDKQQKALKEAAAHAEQYSRQLDQVFNKLKVLDNAGKKHGGWDEWDTQKINEYITKARELINLLAQGGQNTGAAQTRLNELGQSISRTLNASQTDNSGVKKANIFWGILKVLVKSVEVGIKAIGIAIKVVATVTKTVYKVFQKVLSIAKKIGSALVNFVKRIAQFNKHGSKTGGVLSKLWSMFTRMALRKMIQTIFKDMQEGIDALARRSESFNAAFSKIKYAIYDIRNAVVSAIAPLIEIIEPIVTKLLGWITAGIDKIGQALAALNGQKTYKRLKQGAFDYAKSLEKANKAQKQLVSGLDEINKLGDNKDDDDNTLGFYIEEKVIDSDISKVFKHIRDLWNNGEYRETGRYIAQQANKWLKGIDFSDIRLKLNGFADRVVEAINGFFDEFEGDLLGEKIGEAINVALDFINRLLTGIEWNKVFATMGDGVKSLFKTLDEDSIATFIGGIGSVVSEFMMSIFEVIASPEVTDKLTLVIDKVTGKLNEALNDDEWRTRFTTSLGSAIASIINIVAYAIKSIDWKAVGTAVSEVIDIALNNTNGFNIGAAFGGISGAILDIIGNLDWDAICAKIGEGLQGLKTALEDILLDPIIETLSIAIHKYRKITDGNYQKAYNQVGKYLNWDEDAIRKLLQSDKISFFDNGLAIHFKPMFEGTTEDWYTLDSVSNRLNAKDMQRLLKGLADNTYNPDDWFSVGEDMVIGIGDGMTAQIPITAADTAVSILQKIREAEGIHSPSTVMRDEVGIYLGEGIGDGIVQAIPYVIQCASRLMAAVRAVFGSTINYNMGIGTNYGVSALPGIASATIGQVNAGRFGGNGESYMGILSAMLNALQQHSDVYIDGRKVTDVVTQRQRLDAKATGRPVYMSY